MKNKIKKKNEEVNEKEQKEDRWIKRRKMKKKMKRKNDEANKQTPKKSEWKRRIKKKGMKIYTSSSFLVPSNEISRFLLL